MTIPLANPTILFCTLAPTPTLHMSLLEFIILGAFAVGGVELVTTVEDTVLVSAKVWFIEKPISIKLNNKHRAKKLEFLFIYLAVTGTPLLLTNGCSANAM